VPFRFGYCLTAHTAQGGEWPVVYISKPDLLAHQAFCRKRHTEEHAQWSYTAITRARDTLCFLQEHRFLVKDEPMPVTCSTPDGITGIHHMHAAAILPQKEGKDQRKDTSMPVTMTVEPETAAQPSSVPLAPLEATPGIPDDIEDPPVPAGTLEPFNGTVPATVPLPPDALLPLAHGFCQYVQAQLGKQLDEAGIRMARSMDTTITAMADYTKGVLATNEHAQYSFADALAQFARLSAPTPYTLTLHAVSDTGFPIELTIRKETSHELVEEMRRVLGWLSANGYTAQEVAA